MIFENEKQILKIIKYTPSIFIITISLIILGIQFIENNITFEKEKNKIKSQFIEANKKTIESKVQEIYKYIKREQATTENELKITLQTAVNNANSIAQSIYENNKDKDEKFIKKLIVDALRNIRFNEGRGYYFIYENNGRNVLLPHNPELEGKNFWEHKDAKNKFIVQDMIKELSKKDNTFIEWHWYNPLKPDMQQKKIGFVQNFKPFNWFIGTGEYIKDFEKKVQEKVINTIQKIRFENNGYFFIISYDLINLSHINEKFINKNVIENMGTNNLEEVIKDLIKISKEGGGFYSYIQKEKPDNKLPTKKTSFVKGFNDWQWMIGTGFYEDDIQEVINKKRDELDKEFKNYTIKTIKITIILTILLLIASIYFSKILQRKFIKYKNEIRQHLIDKTRQQNIMSQQSKMAAMGEMIGNIAHQWRQPLSAITTGATGIKLQKEMNILSDDFLLEGLTSINNSAQHLSKTIDDFRNFFKVNKKSVYFSIQKTIDKSISLVYMQFHTKDIEIIRNNEDIEIDNFENEFIQVLINLLNNARDELIKKESSSKRYIFINIKKDSKKVIISIKDNAGGINKNIINRIFEPYFTTKHQSQGTGIGLYMSSEIIVKNMKGSISVENLEYTYEGSDYTGANFIIELPIEKIN